MKTDLFLTVTMMPPEKFQKEIESQIWDDMLLYVGLAMGISLVFFLLSKIAG
jgi:hypothetical protein